MKKLCCSIAAMMALIFAFVGGKDGPDVYVAMNVSMPRVSIAGIWSNGVMQNITDGCYSGAT